MTAASQTARLELAADRVVREANVLAQSLEFAPHTLLEWQQKADSMVSVSLQCAAV